MIEIARESRERALDILASTVPQRLHKDIPGKCRDFTRLADRETMEMEAVEGFPWKLYIVRAHNRTERCLVHINIHGGGFFSGHKDNDHMWAAWLAHEIRGIVVDVDYATTQGEAAFPVCFFQCYEAAKWVAAHCEQLGADPRRISMGGYSAGANLTAAVCLKAAETGDVSLCLQILGYPPLDMKTPALYKPEGYTYDLSPERLEAFNTLYFGNDPEYMENPYISPAYARDEVLARTPRALIISAGACNFRYEDENYAARLASLGVEVTVRRVPGARHGFIPHFTEGWEDAAALIVKTIRDAGNMSGM